MAAPFDPHDGPQVRALRTLAEAAARAGGDVARRYFRTTFDVRLKPDRSEVSAADEAAQDAIVALIRAARPDDAFIAEETLRITETGDETTTGLDAPPPDPGGDRVCWVIDPIDGTRNFIRRIPLYATSVAALYRGTPLAGAILDPSLELLYSADPDALYVNGSPRPAGPRQRGLSAKPVVAIPSTPRGRVVELAHRWLDRYVCRSLGSTALHMALVATGELDGAVADNPKLWDIAAGWLLITAAGGSCTGLEGEPLFPVTAESYAGEELPFLARAPGCEAARLR